MGGIRVLRWLTVVGTVVTVVLGTGTAHAQKKTLVVALFMYAENGFTAGERAVGNPYAELLTAAEHEWCEIDNGYRGALEASESDDDAESEAS